MNSVMKAWADLPPIFADRLMALLTAPGRLAHGLHRTNQLLLDADTVAEPHWLRPLRWAILYRYAVFDPLASRAENAMASAELWAEHFPAIHETVRNVSGTWEDEVAAALLADPFDRPDAFLPWQHALLDLDLGWHGATPAVYEAQRLLIVAEFSQAGGTDWDAARRAFVERALACPILFRKVQVGREAAARENLRRELTAIDRPGS
jgi:predicted metal-dependent HD superfamily phosphohydrolase